MKNILTHHRGATMILIILVLVAAALISEGQSFTSLPTTLPDAGRSAVAWADYDNDGDLDLLISGLGGDGMPLAAVYRNDAGQLALIDSLGGCKESSARWGDMDGDGDLDILLAGNTDDGDQTMIYRNDDGDFIQTDPGMVAIQNGDIHWMDVDNDGDLDAFVTGNWTAKIYLNQEGSFEEMVEDFGNYSSSAADWGDFDNDGDLDLLITGDSGAGAVSNIFRNEEGSFTKLQGDFIGLMAGSADWVDYDNDGDLDFSIAGNDDALEAQCFIYRNDGHDNFYLLPLTLDGFALGDADWGDFDNDGDLDMIYSGKCTGCGVAVSGINRNDGDDTFFNLGYLFTALIRCSLQWADYDNDGDLDFVHAGTTYSGTPVTHLYRNDGGNNIFSVNEAPSVPQGLTADVQGSHVHLNWEKSVDDHTMQDGLSYNLRMGMTSVGEEVVPAMALPADGFRKIAALGNTRQRNAWHIENLQPGTYYWSVQAIDQAYQGSAFATEQSFSITATGVEDISGEAPLEVFPNPAGDWISLSSEMLEEGGRVDILDLAGRCHLSSMTRSHNTTLEVSSLSPGMYVARIEGYKKTTTIKFIIR